MTIQAVDDGTYYGRPVLKEPAWTVEVPWYLFTGGLAGASSIVAAVAATVGDARLARVARGGATLGALASPALLIKDLGRPARFLAMLRLLKVTSPLSVGSWMLAAYVPAALGDAALDRLERAGRLAVLRKPAAGVAAASGAGLCVYTGVLLANTAIPVWHEARRELPWLFAASSAASAGALPLVVGVTGPSARRARRLVVLGSGAELAADAVMERRLGPVAKHYEHGRAAPWAKAAKWLTGAGLALTLLARGRTLWRVGGAAVLTGSLCQRFAVFRAGFDSARDPSTTVTRSADTHTRP